ncbi:MULTISPECIES: tyrosine-type recombinase/integrase [unclassified Bradyrhizobium]|uniref:tyrosine-type recombinase/integrase n=1 Tax=unclassified Bradyrhizobium TaxID=2631580 RepID=UPI002916FF06|nr:MULTISPECIES: tyrosine-type recombinase/integrase [unclassified Bradyrhizobium]
MALRMVGLVRAADGRWFARKGIPEDVRQDYARLYGLKREAHLKLPADTPIHEAKARLGEWEAEIGTRIATLRAQRNGEGQPLTRINAIALAGRWYNWFIAQHENDPGPAKRWKEMSDYFAYEVLYPEAPESYHERPKADPHWEWAKEPNVREAVRPQVAELARVATFLASQGLPLNASAYALFVDAVGDNLIAAISMIERRANGDYSRDGTPDSFPPFTEGRIRTSDLGCWELFGAYVAATRPAPQTVSRWRAVFLQMQKDFADVGASGLTEEAARTWVGELITEERSANTVREVWLSAARTVFGWGTRHKHISKNPFADVKVDVPKKIRTRETKAFRPEEARVILCAASAYSDPTTVRDRARRWVPWLCAYSGARAGEMTQLRGRDVKKLGSCYAMTLTPEAGTIKTRKPRIVPIHDHLVEQGFIAFVQKMGDGPLFYNPDTKPEPADPVKPRRSRAATTRAHLSDWVRELGITDPEVKPTHAWRHTFKQTADRVGIPEKMHDEITGHEHATEGRKYGAPTVEDMAEALKKFPRYLLD